MKRIAFTGGKGGVGKSLVASNTAIALGQVGKRVVLFDADLQLANLDVMLGIKAEFNLQHVVTEQLTLSEVLAEGPGRIRVATGGSAVQGLMNAGPKRMGTFLGQLDGLESTTDFLIFDTGAGLDNRVMTFLRLADEVVLVTTPDPTSVTDAYATAKVLFKRDPNAQVSVLVNFVRTEAEAHTIFRTLNAICKQFLERELSYLGYVRADLSAMESVRSRRPLMVSDANADAAKDILRIAMSLQSRSALRQVA